jgi:hypothetical protein
MKLGKVVLGGILLAFASIAAHAADMSYSYVDVNWVNLDADSDELGISESADGFGVNGSVGFGENFFGFVDYRSVEGDIFGTNFDIDQVSVGLGGHYGISESADLVGRIGYTQLDASVSGFGSEDVDGFLLSAGVRGELAEDFELEGHVIYTDLGDDGGDDTSFAVDARYFFTEQFALDAGYETGDDLDIWHVGIRFAF